MLLGFSQRFKSCLKDYHHGHTIFLGWLSRGRFNIKKTSAGWNYYNMSGVSPLHRCNLYSGWLFVPRSFHQSSVTLLISTKHCCQLAFLGAERKQQDPFNGQASIYWWPSIDPPSSADGADFDGCGSHHWSYLHDLLSGAEFVPPSLLAGVVACRPAPFLIISTFCGICPPARQRCLLGFHLPVFACRRMRTAPREAKVGKNVGRGCAKPTNVDKELQKSARKNLRGVDPSIGKYMAALEHEVCRLEKANAQLTQQLTNHSDLQKSANVSEKSIL